MEIIIEEIRESSGLVWVDKRKSEGSNVLVYLIKNPHGRGFVSIKEGRYPNGEKTYHISQRFRTQYDGIREINSILDNHPLGIIPELRIF